MSESLKLVSITAYRDYVSNFENDNDTSPMAHSLGYGPLTFGFFSQKAGLNGTIGDGKEIEYTLGGYFSNQESVYTSFQGPHGSGRFAPGSCPLDRGQCPLYRAACLASRDRRSWGESAAARAGKQS